MNEWIINDLKCRVCVKKEQCVLVFYTSLTGHDLERCDPATNHLSIRITGRPSMHRFSFILFSSIPANSFSSGAPERHDASPRPVCRDWLQQIPAINCYSTVNGYLINTAVKQDEIVAREFHYVRVESFTAGHNSPEPSERRNWTSCRWAPFTPEIRAISPQTPANSIQPPSS